MTLIQGHSAHISKSVSDPKLFTLMLDLDDFLHKRTMTLTQDHIAKIKVTVHT